MLRAFRFRILAGLLLMLFGLPLLVHAQSEDDAGTRLLQTPSVEGETVVFAYAGEIWRTPLDGGDAERLTSFAGVASNPQLSPDGSQVAFSGRYNGQTDVYVVSVDGGTPERLTYHPGTDTVQGWTPDGSQIVFASGRDSAPASYQRFWTIGVGDATPDPLPIPRGDVGGFGPDGERFVYQPITRWQDHWRGYRGGQVHPIWILDMETYEHTELPFEETIDTQPVWAGDTVYFLSDRADNMVMNVYAYNVDDESLTQVTDHTEFDVKSLDVDGSTLVYEQGGYLHRHDLQQDTQAQLEVTVRGDFPWTQRQWKEVGPMASNADLSPNGVRAVMEARGEIFTIPAEDGSWRNLSQASDAADRYPAWSPDGSQIAWFTDRDGEYALRITNQQGGDARSISLPNDVFYYRPQWSPDSERLLFTDTDRNLWVLDVESEETTRIDQDLYTPPGRTMNPQWSPDGEWIAYAKRLDSQFRTVYAYSLEDEEAIAMSDGMADAVNPVWDASGKYLYFMASTDYGLNTGWLDMSSYERPIDRSVYLTVLSDDEPSPLLPQSDEEATGDSAQNGDEENGSDEEVDVRIDPEGLAQRTQALDLPERAYQSLHAGTAGTVFVGESVPNAPGLHIHQYQLDAQEAKPFLEGVTQFEVAHSGEQVLYQAQGQWGIVPTAQPPSPGDGALDLSGVEMPVDPPAEWQQIFEEAWRFHRDYLYVENYHGLDWPNIYDLYAPWVDHVRHRDDLNYVLELMVGELSLGHTYVGGGDVPDGDGPGTGLLGADLEADGERYRIERIYDGEAWNPNLNAPLRAPGLDVETGDYILAVEGRSLTTDMNPYAPFEGTAGRTVTLLVNDEPTTDGAREVTVEPIGSDSGLRTRAWIEDNRRYVEEQSDGELGYVYVPNTAQAGYDSFNRYYFAQQDRSGMVIDERFNGGGSAADYMVDIMSRELHGFFNNPIAERTPFTTPGAGVWGPKVLIANEAAGSGGDLLPYLFRRMEIGPIVGRRTWGGLVGIWDTPPLLDGGTLTVPRGGFFDRDGNWAVENEGVSPDIPVVQTPREVIEGEDPQLDRAIEEAMMRLPEEDPVLDEPAPPVRAPRALPDDE